MENFTSEETKTMLTAFKELNVKPNLDSPAEFKDWMVKYVTDLTLKGESKDNDDSDKGASASSTATKGNTSSYIPKLSVFSGNGSAQDTPFELWKYEVECLVRDKYSESSISLAIRRSLRGEAGAAIMRLGPDAKVADIIQRMDDIFGSIEREESIMEQFYSASQRKDEDSMKWSCRLEELMRRAINKGLVKKDDSDGKLQSRFWNGLQPWLKDITGYKFDSSVDFNELRREVRMIEKDHDKKSTHSMALTAGTEDKENSEMKELRGMISQLTSKVDSMQQQQQSFAESGQQPHQMVYQQQHVGYYQHQPHYGYGRRPFRGRGRGRWRGNRQQRQDYQPGYQQGYGSQQQQAEQQPQQYQQQQYQQQQPQQEPECFRCGQTGHLAIGCRVILDHSKRGLNCNRPGSRGRR